MSATLERAFFDKQFRICNEFNTTLLEMIDLCMDYSGENQPELSTLKTLIRGLATHQPDVPIIHIIRTGYFIKMADAIADRNEEFMLTYDLEAEAKANFASKPEETVKRWLDFTTYLRNTWKKKFTSKTKDQVWEKLEKMYLTYCAFNELMIQYQISKRSS